MKFTVQVIVHPDDDTDASPIVREVLTFDRDYLTADTLGLQLAEAKELLAAVQDTVAGHQASAAITKLVACPDCGRPRRHKDTRTIVVRTLFGALRVASPRWWHCGCRDQRTRTFQPLAGLLPERTTPELAHQQARFAALVSYGITADLLGELLPLGRRLHPAVVRGSAHNGTATGDSGLNPVALPPTVAPMWAEARKAARASPSPGAATSSARRPYRSCMSPPSDISLAVQLMTAGS